MAQDTGEHGMSGTLIVASGRWDNNVAVIDAAAARDPANDGTDRAVLSRPRATPDVDGAPASGQPVSVLVPPTGPHAYVVCHSGRASIAAAGAYQHGHPGTVTLLDLAALRDPRHDGTTGAIAGIVETGTSGPVGSTVTPDGRHLLVGSAEAPGAEDGGVEVTAIARDTMQVAARIRLRDGGGTPVRDSPHPDFGRFPNPNGIAVSPRGTGWLLTANGGTDDVSIIDLAAGLAGDPGAEVARVPVQSGGFGIQVSPDGNLAAVAARESMRTGAFGNTVSLIDIAARREVSRIRVGTDDPAVGTRPFVAAFTPDGRHLVASCFASGTVSLIELASGREVSRLALEDPTGGPAQPRGIAISADGAWAAVTGGKKRGPRSSVLWMLDLARFAPTSRVTGIGNETYLLGILPAGR
jgi:DNA-binding beta-propeller fold protein YncE